MWVMRTTVERPRPQPAAVTCANEADCLAAFLDESLLTVISKQYLNEADPKLGSDRGKIGVLHSSPIPVRHSRVKSLFGEIPIEREGRDCVRWIKSVAAPAGSRIKPTRQK
jgi:hypothetical protein